MWPVRKSEAVGKDVEMLAWGGKTVHSAVDRKRRKERSARTYVSSHWAGAMEEQPACSKQEQPAKQNEARRRELGKKWDIRPKLAGSRPLERPLWVFDYFILFCILFYLSHS